MHLVDSVGKNSAVRYYCNYHEQACAISAEAYARVRGGIGVCLVTTGPGGVNALSGIAGAWVDSIPVVVISGQVRRDLIADYSKVRQRGPQEGNVVAMARPVTKYAKTILDPLTVRYELELAFHTAVSGRPGPVWIDIPLDVQGSEIDETGLPSYEPREDASAGLDVDRLRSDVAKVFEMLKSARRPVMICGTGIHLSGSEGLLRELIERLRIPVILPVTAKDLIEEDHPLNLGIFGTIGQRRANFALQNSDCILSLAAGLNCAKTGFNYRGFGPKAGKIVVDIDEGQLYHQVVTPDVGVLADVGAFLKEMLCHIGNGLIEPPVQWLEACAHWKRRYPLLVDGFFSDQEHVNSYVFMDRLSEQLVGSDIMVAGNGLDCVSYFQAFKAKVGQRTINNGNWGAMGWDLPASVGACIGSGGRRTVCVTGDGSMQLNVQELLTISHHKLPVKIFVFNNGGYSSIRATQKTFFDGRLVGADRSSGVSDPDFGKLSAAYGIGYAAIRDNGGLEDGIRRVLTHEGPILCEVNISQEQEIIPKASAYRKEDGTLESRPLEDMYPFLPRDEIWENMNLFCREPGT